LFYRLAIHVSCEVPSSQRFTVCFKPRAGTSHHSNDNYKRKTEYSICNNYRNKTNASTPDYTKTVFLEKNETDFLMKRQYAAGKAQTT
jgi:hypothetical protein